MSFRSFLMRRRCARKGHQINSVAVSAMRKNVVAVAVLRSCACGQVIEIKHKGPAR